MSNTNIEYLDNLLEEIDQEKALNGSSYLQQIFSKIKKLSITAYFVDTDTV